VIAQNEFSHLTGLETLERLAQNFLIALTFAATAVAGMFGPGSKITIKAEHIKRSRPLW
jgi:hypothetical protein